MRFHLLSHQPVVPILVLFLLLFTIVPTTLSQDVPCDPNLTLGEDQAAYLLRAAACLDQSPRNAEQAVFDTSRVIADDPDNAQAYILRSRAHFWLRQFGQAIADTTLALYLEPDTVDHYVQRAFFMSQIADYDGALKDISSAIDLEPTDVNLYLERVRYLLETGDVEMAVQDLQTIISLDATDPSAYQLLGDIYYEQEAYEQALENYQLYLEQSTNPLPIVRARVMIIENRLGEN